MELYLHFPFCAQKCCYCDFASYTGQAGKMPAYIDAVLHEAALRAHELSAPAIETVFLGGGTPSLMPSHLLEKLFSGLRTLFPMADVAEFTCEANPGTVTASWLDTAVQQGMTRLSMGMQALQPSLLRMLGRIHDFDQVCASVQLARQAGVKELSLDLMFGLPGQTVAQWRDTINAAFSLSPAHLSCYGLIPEEGTPLKRALDKGTLTLPEEDAEREMYDLAIDLTRRHGMRQYEISNFALPGSECRHNLGYWRQVPYLGLGASASSCLPDETYAAAYLRTTNPSGLEDYLAMDAADSWTERECIPVNREDARFETMMLGLRTITGVSEAEFFAMHGVSLDALYGARLREMSAEGLLLHCDGRWALTRRGMDVQNTILVNLMDD